MKPRAIALDGVPAAPDVVGLMILLDRSSSMGSIRQVMEQEFAKFVAQQKALPGTLWLTLRQFDDIGYTTIYDRLPIADVGGLQLAPRGSTPLADALVRFCGEAKAVIDDPSDDTQRLLLMVISDGQENCSKSHSMAEAKAALAAIEGPDCEVLWIGNNESVHHALATGVSGQSVSSASLSWGSDAVPDVAYASAGFDYAATSYRSGGSATRALRSYAMTHVPPASPNAAPDVARGDDDLVIATVTATGDVEA